MAFNAYGASQKESTTSNFDFNAFNQDIVAQAGLQNREVLTGVVASIVDLGLQERADAEVPFDGDAAAEAAEIAKNPNTYFIDGTDDKGNKIRLRCWKQKPIQCVALAIDFPEVIVDKGKHFGDSNPLPLRVYMGSQFYNGSAMVVQRMTELKTIKKDNVWQFDNKHQLHKMAVASKLIEPTGVFTPAEIDKLLGQSMQFEVQVFMKKGKDGKEYFTEYLKFMGPLSRSQKPLELPYPTTLIQFKADNGEKDIKDLRAHIVNTIKRANNYEGSKIKAQIETYRAVGNTTEQAPADNSQAAAPVANNKPVENTPADDEEFF